VKIVICMKETPSTTAEKRFGADMRLERRKEDAIINPFDEYSIEEGLRQQEKHGGETIVLCMGPETATDTIRKALAMGADRGVLVTDAALAGSDAVATARVLAAALQNIGPSAVAEFLGLPLLSFAAKLDIDGTTAKIERAAEVGYNVVEAQTPALVSVMKSINEPRYPSMKGIMQSKKKPIDTMSLADLGIEAGKVGADASGEKALSAEKIATQRKGEIYMGNEGAAERVVAFLAEQKVL
jgi:electron transfer flavoprotein beta subunit